MMGVSEISERSEKLSIMCLPLSSEITVQHVARRHVVETKTESRKLSTNYLGRETFDKFPSQTFSLEFVVIIGVAVSIHTDCRTE